MPDDVYRLAADRAPADQFALGLQVPLDPATPIHQLTIGDRFLLEDSNVEGRLVAKGSGSATVAVRGEDDRWSRTTWSLATLVRRMRA